METTKGKYFHPTFSHDPMMPARTNSVCKGATDLGSGQWAIRGIRGMNPWGIHGVKLGRNHQKWGEHKQYI